MDRIVKMSAKMALSIKCMDLGLSDSTMERILTYTKSGGPEKKEQLSAELLALLDKCENEADVIAALNSNN